jgi:hypothetical protein
MVRVKKRALVAAKQAGAKPEQARAYADAAHKLDFKSMRRLAKQIGIEPDLAKEIEAESHCDLSKSLDFWLAPGYSVAGKERQACEARQPWGPTARRRVMSLGRGSGMDTDMQREFWNAFSDARTNDLAKIAGKYGINKTSIGRLQELSKTRRRPP